MLQCVTCNRANADRTCTCAGSNFRFLSDKILKMEKRKEEVLLHITKVFCPNLSNRLLVSFRPEANSNVQLL